MNIADAIAEIDEDILLMNGYDDCLIGVANRFGMETVAAYDIAKIIDRHIAEGMTEDEAVEFFEFNQIGAWVGEKTPVFVRIIREEP